MDPLSIATGATSLVITASKLSVWLYTLIKEIKGVDSKLTALSKEVTSLITLLTSVESTMQKCQSQTLALVHLDEQIWQQLDNIMVDCQITLEGLDRVLVNIRSDSSSKNFMRLLKKPSMHFKLSTQMEDITNFMSKIYKLNCALQTAIAVVNISLSFRTNASQELIFRELRSLKSLVEEALIASHNKGSSTDPFAARLTRNLRSLAKAAQQFHSTASSTASTQHGGGRGFSYTSNWSGSDFGRLDDSQRQRIERWNDQLQVVEEVPEDHATTTTTTTTTTEETPITDHSTVLTMPDIEETSPKIYGRRECEDEEESADDDSDIELDFLKNFDELACTSFARKDYSRAEQFLRKAMERSTGESSGETDFKLLRVRLAICCCLQDRWEFAAGALAPLSKSKTTSNLPVFHLLQAISLGYLANNRLEDAHSVCKTTLQGKKKILGKTSDDFSECLSILADIYEKKGDSLEAEAVRLSIPAGWKPRTPEDTRSGKQYILDHENLIGFAFGKKSTRTDNISSSNTSANGNDAPAPWSGHWKTLIRHSRDGQQQADKDERAGAPLGETDTGKEFLFQTKEELVPRRGTGMGILRAINDEYSGKQVGEFDSGKEVAVGTPENSISGRDKIIVMENNQPESSRRNSSSIKPETNLHMAPWWPLKIMCKWENLMITSADQETRQKIDSDWYSTLELVSHISTPSTTVYESYDQQIANSTPKGSESSNQIAWKIDNPVNIRSRDSLVTTCIVPLDNVPSDKSVLDNGHRSIGASLGLGGASFGMLQEYDSITLCETSISYSQDPHTLYQGSPPLDSNNVWIDYPWNFLRMLLIHDNSRDLTDEKSLFSSGLITTKCPDWMDNFDAAASTSKRLEDLEAAILTWKREMEEDGFSSTNIKAVAVSVPDIMARRTAKVLSYRFAANSLFRHAKLLPSSLAIAYSFIKSKAISQYHFEAQGQKTDILMVLNCDEVLVECISYFSKVLDDAYIELSPTESATAEMYGSLHAEMEFSKFVLHRLTSIMARFKVKFAPAATSTIIKKCREQFQKHIFPFFMNNGKSWLIDFDIPQDFPSTETQQLEFNNDMILECFKPSMRAIRKMMIKSVLQNYERGYVTSHVLLAGKYASSSFLNKELHTAVTELGMGTIFLGSSNYVYSSTIGTLNYLGDSEFRCLQGV